MSPCTHLERLGLGEREVVLGVIVGAAGNVGEAWVGDPEEVPRVAQAARQVRVRHVQHPVPAQVAQRQVCVPRQLYAVLLSADNQTLSSRLEALKSKPLKM